MIVVYYSWKGTEKERSSNMQGIIKDENIQDTSMETESIANVATEKSNLVLGDRMREYELRMMNIRTLEQKLFLDEVRKRKNRARKALLFKKF